METPIARGHASVAEELYLKYYSLLARIAVRRFQLSLDDAENAIQDVFITYLRSTAIIRDPRAWLVGAICNRCRRFRAGVTKTIVPKQQFALPNAEAPILCAQLLRRLPVRTQRVLTLHYVEGFSALEIAAEFNTTPRYAERLIHLSITQARSALEVQPDS